MNKYEKSLDKLHRLALYEHKPTDRKLVKMVRMDIANLKSLVDRATPKQPNYVADGYDENGELVYDTAYCPVCGHGFEYGINDWESKFCSDCGQALDWSDKNANLD